MKRVGGFRRKSRHKFARTHKEKGKLTLTKYFQVLNEGDRVCLKANPSFQNGMYHPRFHGLSGVIKGKAQEGRCYEIIVKDQGKEKTLIVHPVHLNKLN